MMHDVGGSDNGAECPASTGREVLDMVRAFELILLPRALSGEA